MRAMDKPAAVVAVTNQKGGVGKTTSVVDLAVFCALGGRRVLVIDNDPQGNASSVFVTESVESSIYSGGQPLKTFHERLWLMPAGDDLADQEARLRQLEGGKLALHRLLEPLRLQYDVIVIDCPPSVSSLSVNAWLAADWVVVPLQCEYYALEGLSQLLQNLAGLEHVLGRSPALAGILLTMHEPRFGLGHQVAAEVRSHFRDKTFASVIPRDIALAAAPSHGQTILDYDPLSPGGLAYLAAAKELLHVIER
jgi:chromosome partitioning protein